MLNSATEDNQPRNNYYIIVHAPKYLKQQYALNYSLIQRSTKISTRHTQFFAFSETIVSIAARPLPIYTSYHNSCNSSNLALYTWLPLRGATCSYFPSTLHTRKTTRELEKSSVSRVTRRHETKNSYLYNPTTTVPIHKPNVGYLQQVWLWQHTYSC